MVVKFVRLYSSSLKTDLDIKLNSQMLLSNVKIMEFFHTKQYCIGKVIKFETLWYRSGR